MCFIALILFSLLLNVHKCAYSDDNELNVIKLNCTFQEFDGDPYGCKAVHLSVNSRRTRIESIIHTKARSYTDVLTFYAFNPDITYVPKRIGDFFPNLQKFLITKSSLRYIEWRDFKNMKYLKTLYLYENKIERISQCAFQYLDNLENINLDGNRIKSLNEKLFINVPNLAYLSANKNNIVRLETDLFQNNAKLKEIFFRDNQIEVIKINFRQLRMLKFVDLRSNQCISISFTCCEYFNEFIGNITRKCEGPGFCNK